MLKFFQEYFSLSNTEQRGVFSLIIIILFVFVGSKMYLKYQPATSIPQDNTALLASFYEQPKEEVETATAELVAISYFNFDPNTSSLESLISLGFPPKTAETLINFRSKGGKFYKKEDLKKVYGVSEELYANLETYIAIPKKVYPKKEYSNNYSDNKESYDYPKEGYSKKSFEKKEVKTFEIVNINSADSSTLTTIKGVGPAYASRIVKYRKMLGGFLSKEQLLEVYGIDDEVYSGIKDQVEINGNVAQINVNSTTWAELKSHPYISSDLANIILNYKKNHEDYTSLDVLIENNLLDEEELGRILPYLKFE